MRLGKNRTDFEIEVKSIIDIFVKTVNASQIDNIVFDLSNKHGIKETLIYSIFNNTNNLSSLEMEGLSLFSEKIAHYVGINVNEFLNEWFTERELKEFKRYQYVDFYELDEFQFPYMFESVSDLGNGYYLVALSMEEIARMRKYGKLNYNENVQRGLKKSFKYGIEILQPIIFNKKIQSIKKNIQQGVNIPSTIVLNAVQMSANDGIELDFDQKKKTLIINEGAILDIVDGMHRVLGTYQAWLENKKLKGYYACIMSNKSDKEVMLHQVDINKSTKLLAGRTAELSNKSYMNEVINILKMTNELNEKITSGTDSKDVLKNEELFPYKILLQILENQFEVNSTLEARVLAEKIKEYNVYLFGYFGKHLNDDYKFIFDADIYEGHMVLLKMMNENKIPYEKLNEIIELQDFNVKSKLFENLVKNNKLKKLNKKESEKIISHFKNYLNR